MPRPQLTIATERNGVTLKQLRIEDAKDYFALIDHDRPHFQQHGDQTESKYQTLADVQESIQHPDNPEKLRFGIWDDDIMVGMVGLIPQSGGSAETGGWTGSQFCRKGYAHIARRALARTALNLLGHTSVFASIHPDNVASQRMVEKAGYRFDQKVPERGLRYVFSPDE